MIFIKKPLEPPSKLIEFQKLLEEVKRNYSGFNNIPEVERNRLINHYKHEDIKRILFKCSHNKCAFCETIPYGSYLEVEHYAPKNLYPELILDWENLLPSCRKCNNYKHDHDSISEPIINPCKVDPEPYFDYEFLYIKPASNSPDQLLAQRTIQVCNLNRRQLNEARVKLLLDLTHFDQQLEKSIQELNEMLTFRKKKNRILNLQESFEILESFTKPEKIYSGLCKNFIRKSKNIKLAKKCIEDFKSFHPDVID